MSVEVPVPTPPPVAAPASPRTAGRTAGRTAAERAVAPPAEFAPVFTTTAAPTTGWTATSVAGRPVAGASVRGHWLTAAVTTAVMTAFAVLIVSGRVVTEGPVLLVLSRTHGIHLGDLYVLVAWCAGVAAPVARGLRLHRAARRR